MHRRPLLKCVALVSFAASCLAQQAQVALNPQALIERAISAAENQRVLPRYTYFVLKHTQNRTPKGKVFLDDTTLYEYTWIGDLPYGRIIENQGKPLKGKALADEQDRYDKAVTDHAGLDVKERLRDKHYTLLDTSLHLEPLLTGAYTISEPRQETIAGTRTHVIDCTPVLSGDSAHPSPTRHVTLWMMNSGSILRDTYEVVTDETDRLHGSHGQEDFQMIDGYRLPLHKMFHLNAPNGNTGDFEETYSRFRRFNVSVNIVPANEPINR